MNIQLYTLAKKTNSTMRPTGTGRVVGIQLKSPCSILNPVLEGATYYPENYCYIPDWGRYYFIREKTYVNGAWMYELECDYLATWKTEIGASTFYVNRSASERNSRMIDTAFPLNGDYIVAGSADNSALSIGFNAGCIVIGVLGDNGTGQTLYTLSPNNFQTLLSDLLVTADGLQWTDIPQGAKNSIMNPTQYITSCRWYPFTFADSYNLTSLKAGLWQGNVACAKVRVPYPESSVFTKVFHVPNHPQTSSRGFYTNMKPFTTLIMELPSLGLFELDESLMYQYPYLRVRLMLDPYNGVGTWDGWGMDEEQNARCMVFKKDAQIGVDIPLSSQDKAMGGFVSGVLGAIATTAFGVASAFATEGASLGVTVARGIGSGASALNQLKTGYEELTSGVQSTNYTRGTLQELMNFKTYLTAIFRDQCEVDVTNKGRPLSALRRLDTLSGYMEVMTASVSLPVSDEEMNIVNRQLESGFYYE